MSKTVSVPSAFFYAIAPTFFFFAAVCGAFIDATSVFGSDVAAVAVSLNEPELQTVKGDFDESKSESEGSVGFLTYHYDDGKGTIGVAIGGCVGPVPETLIIPNEIDGEPVRCI